MIFYFVKFLFNLDFRLDRRCSFVIMGCLFWAREPLLFALLEETTHLIALNWHICFWNFHDFCNLVHWIMLATIYGLLSLFVIFNICCTSVLICMSRIMNCLCFSGRGLKLEKSMSLSHTLYCAPRHRELLLTWGMIPVSAPETCLGSRWTSPGSTTYAMGLARFEGECVI